MTRKFLRRISREYRQNETPWYLSSFSAILRHPRYFALNRRSVTGALAIGVFISLLPLPGHTALALLVALWARVNLGVAGLAAWANNPLTMAPVFYAEYRLGTFLLNIPAQPFPEELSWSWLMQQIQVTWMPLWLGALVVATVTTTVVYFAANAAWHYSARRRYQRRRERHRA